MNNGAIVDTASRTALRGSTADAACIVSRHGIIGLPNWTAAMYPDRGVRTGRSAHPATHPN